MLNEIRKLLANSLNALQSVCWVGGVPSWLVVIAASIRGKADPLGVLSELLVRISVLSDRAETGLREVFGRWCTDLSVTNGAERVGGRVLVETWRGVLIGEAMGCSNGGFCGVRYRVPRMWSCCESLKIFYQSVFAQDALEGGVFEQLAPERVPSVNDVIGFLEAALVRMLTGSVAGSLVRCAAVRLMSGRLSGLTALTVFSQFDFMRAGRATGERVNGGAQILSVEFVELITDNDRIMARTDAVDVDSIDSEDDSAGMNVAVEKQSREMSDLAEDPAKGIGDGDYD